VTASATASGTASVRIVAVIQARMGSSRLPGKVLRPVAGATLLERMIERVTAARSIDEIVVATTRRPEDRAIIEVCQPLRVPVYAGDPTDLLDRHLQAARAMGAEALVKIPSDCPLIDPRIIDRVVGHYRENEDRYDFVSNLHPASYPDGNDVEVVPLEVLELADRQAVRPHEREHTTPFLWDQPDRFRIGNVVWETGLDYSMSHRFTVDYAEDLAFVRAVFDELQRPGESPFSLDEILQLLQRRADIFALNRHLAGVNWYRHHLGELRTVGQHETQRPGAR
jgi:spore coat polysaccharide biosynthesis protein SpsF